MLFISEWFNSPKYYLNSSSELSYFDEQKFVNNYLNKKMQSTSISSFVDKVISNPSNHFLTIECKIHGRILPMIDCDSFSDVEKTTKYLDSKELGYALFNSSNMHGWIFPGFSFNSFEAAFSAVKDIPGCDAKYMKIAKERKSFMVRGDCKNYQDSPKLLEITTKEPCVSLFAKLLNEHFSSKWFKEIMNFRNENKVWSRPNNVHSY